MDLPLGLNYLDAFKENQIKVSLYPKLWSLKGISTISKSIVFNCIVGEGEFVLYYKFFVVWCYSNRGCKNFVWKGTMVRYMQMIISMGQRWVVLKWTCLDGNKINIKSNPNHLEGIICVVFSLVDIFIWIIVNPLCS
jgi:hypothetical protein